MCNSDTSHNHLHLGCCNNPRGQLCSCHKIIHGIPGKEAFCPPRAVIPSSFLTGLCLVCHQKVLPMTVRFQSLSSTQAVNHTKEMVKLETQLFLSVQAVFQLDQTEIRGWQWECEGRRRQGKRRQGASSSGGCPDSGWFAQSSNHNPDSPKAEKEQDVPSLADLIRITHPKGKAPQPLFLEPDTTCKQLKSGYGGKHRRGSIIPPVTHPQLLLPSALKIRGLRDIKTHFMAGKVVRSGGLCASVFNWTSDKKGEHLGCSAPGCWDLNTITNTSRRKLPVPASFPTKQRYLPPGVINMIVFGKDLCCGSQAHSSPASPSAAPSRNTSALAGGGGCRDIPLFSPAERH